MDGKADSLAPLFEAVEPAVPAPLVSTQSLANIRALTAMLPRIAVERCGMECRLGPGVHHSDLAVRIGRGAVRHLVARFGRSETVWRQLHRLEEEWVRPGSFLHDRLGSLWLEFDLDGPPQDPPVPIVFLSGLVWDGLDGNGVLQAVYRFRDAALSLQPHRSRSAEEADALDNCLRRIPPDGQILHVGELVARAETGLRLVIAMDWNGVVPYLEQIDWTGDRAALERLGAAMAERSHGVSVAFEIGQQTAGTVGLEFFPTTIYRNEEELTRLLDVLVAEGLSTQEKRRAVLAWPGEVEDVAGARFVVRAVSHFKLVFRPNGAIEAKAYFGFAESSQPPSIPFYPMLG